MEQFFSNLFQSGASIAAAGIALVSPFLLVLMIIAAVGVYKAITKARQARQYGASQSVSRSMALSKGLYYDKKRGWLLENIPSSMVADLKDKTAKELFFSLNGVANLIKASRSGSNVEFSFLVKDMETARLLVSALKDKSFNARVMQQPDGMYKVFSSDADAISFLADLAYPMQEKTAARDVTVMRQYSIDGCKSYDEAVEKLKSNRDNFQPFNEVVNLDTFIDGEKVKSNQSGTLVDANITDTPLGTYIVSESTKYHSDTLLKVPSGMTRPEDLLAFAEGKLADVKSLSPEIAIPMDYFKKRFYIEGTDIVDGHSKDVKFIVEEDANIKGHAVKAYAIFDSMDELDSALKDCKIKEGTYVSLGRERPEGKYVVEVDVPSNDSLAAYKVTEPLPQGVSEAAEKYNVSDSDLQCAHVRYEIEKDGYANSVTKSDVSISNGKVNGVDVNEYKERIANDRLPDLDEAGRKKWMEDAAVIQSVDMTVDTRLSEVRFTTHLVDVETGRVETKIEKRPLSEEELRSLETRGNISQSELKDLMMQCHPDVFLSYRSPRSSGNVPFKSTVKDPVGDFIHGRKNTLVSKSNKSLKKNNLGQSKSGPKVGM